MHKQDLIDKRQRLDTVLKADIPILDDVARSSRLDIERLRLVLTDYSNLIDACLHDLDLEEKQPR